MVAGMMTRVPLVGRVVTPGGGLETGLRCMATDSGDGGGLFSKFNFGKASEKKRKERERELAIEQLHQREQEVLKSAELEIAESQLQRRRNKSGLHHSDRQMLKGAPPAVGLFMQWKERHTTRQYKAEMLGKFGRSRTGVHPSVSWPTKEEMESQREYERVLYDGTSLQERMDLHNRVQQFRKQKMVEYEQEIDANLAKMDKEIKAWKQRVEKRNADAAKEKSAKDQIFAELKQEFGYEIDPADPIFQDKIAEKEKAIAKKMKLEKRSKREEEARIKAEEEQKAKADSAAKIKAAAAAAEAAAAAAAAQSNQ